GEQAHTDDAGNLVEGGLHGYRIGNRQSVDIEDQVSVVGDDPTASGILTPDGLGAGHAEYLPGDQAAGHRNDFDRQGEASENVHPLGGINDADKFCAGLCDDLLACQRGTAALDQALVGVAFVGAIDVKGQWTGGIQIEY